MSHIRHARITVLLAFLVVYGACDDASQSVGKADAGSGSDTGEPAETADRIDEHSDTGEPAVVFDGGSENNETEQPTEDTDTNSGKNDSETDSEVVSDLDSDVAVDRSGCPYTTLDQTLQPLVEAVTQTGDNRGGWGLLEIGPGEQFVERDDLGVGDTAEAPLGDPSSLAFLWTMTDTHIVDEESPARLINGDTLFDSAYRNHESWSTQLLEGALRTLRAFNSCHPLDFTLLTGDLIDNRQRNEMAWFIQVMEGGLVDPDSGADEDPFPGEANDQHDSFSAVGHPANLPWYAVPGNHDLLSQGNGSMLDWMLADPLGDKANLSILSLGLNNAVTPVCLDEPWYDTESTVPARCYMPPRSYFKNGDIIPDTDRAFIGILEWLEYFFGTETIPDGHGFTAENLKNGTASYVVDDVVPGMPIVLIVLNTVAESGSDGVFDDARREWLITKLDQAELDNKMVIVSSHHTAANMEGVQKDQLVAVLNSYPHVALHIGGHSHKNRIRPHPAPEGLPPEHGYWEIESSGTMDWPQQTRLLEFVDNRDGTGAIYSTMIDFQIPSDMQMLEGGRFYGLFDIQSGISEEGRGELTDRNAILRIAFPPALADKLALLDEREVMTFAFEPK